MSKVKIKKSETVENLLNNGTVVVTKGKKYFFSPFWFEEDGDEFIAHQLGSLPKDLLESISIERKK